MGIFDIAPSPLFLNTIGFAGSKSIDSTAKLNNMSFAGARILSKDYVTFETTVGVRNAKQQKAPRSDDFCTMPQAKPYRCIQKSQTINKKPHEYEAKTVIDRKTNWSFPENSIRASSETKALSVFPSCYPGKYGPLPTHSTADGHSPPYIKTEKKALRSSNSTNTSHAIIKKRAGKRRTIKRGGVRMHLDEFGQEILALEGSWLSEQFRLAAMMGSRGTQKLIDRLTEVMLESLKSLYMDGIKPWLGDVAHRLRPSFNHLLTLAEVKGLAEMCGEKVMLAHEMRCKGEEGCVVYLTEEPEGYQGFVDIHNTDDPFTQYQWQLFYSHMISLMQYDAVATKDKPYEFRGGRYAFAELMQRSVEEFRNKRLGELCHMVQLSIHNGALTYVNCVLQPSSACYSKTRAITQVTHSPVETRHPVCQTIEEVVKIAAALTDHLADGLVLAQLKQKFQREFNRDLDPEVFGYMKLQQLFLCKPLSSIYRLYTPRNSPHRTIVQNIRYQLPEGAVLFKAEVCKETKLDKLLAAMSLIRYDSNISFEFMSHKSAWSPQAAVDETSWDQLFAGSSSIAKPLQSSSYVEPNTPLADGGAAFAAISSNATGLLWSSSVCRKNKMHETADHRKDMNQEDCDARLFDDTASLDDLHSVTSTATTDTTSATPPSFPVYFSPCHGKHIQTLSQGHSFIELGAEDSDFSTRSLQFLL